MSVTVSKNIEVFDMEKIGVGDIVSFDNREISITFGEFKDPRKDFRRRVLVVTELTAHCLRGVELSSVIGKEGLREYRLSAEEAANLDVRVLLKDNW